MIPWSWHTHNHPLILTRSVISSSLNSDKVCHFSFLYILHTITPWSWQGLSFLFHLIGGASSTCIPLQFVQKKISISITGYVMELKKHTASRRQHCWGKSFSETWHSSTLDWWTHRVFVGSCAVWFADQSRTLWLRFFPTRSTLGSRIVSSTQALKHNNLTAVIIIMDSSQHLILKKANNPRFLQNRTWQQ